MECLNPFGKANLIALDDYLIYRGASQVMYLFFYIYNILFPSETKIMPTLPRMVELGEIAGGQTNIQPSPMYGQFHVTF